MNFEMTDSDPNTCASMCAFDSACKAYTFVGHKPGGHKAQCWLKNVEVPAVENECCISGVRKESRNANPSENGRPLAFVFSQRTKKDRRSGYKFPNDMPAVRWPTSYDSCSVSDRKKIHRAWALAHFYAWRAHQVMEYLARNERQRRKLWNYDYINDYPRVPNYENVSMRGWYGPYDSGRFRRIRDAVEKVWKKRFLGKTYTVKCRKNDGNKGAHPCYRRLSSGNFPSANHIVHGTINFCNSWFEKSASTGAKTVVHELYHWLKIPNSALWVSDRHDYWESCSSYHRSTPLYGKKAVFIANNPGCKERNYKRTVINNDNYAYFTYMFGKAVFDKKTDRGLKFTKFPGAGFVW